MMLPGWNCASCLAFNGEEKVPRETCRSCGSVRKTFGLPLESIMRYVRTLEENLTKAQGSGTDLHNRIVRDHNDAIETIHDLSVKLETVKEAAQALINFALEEAYYPLRYDGKFRQLIQALQKATLNG